MTEKIDLVGKFADFTIPRNKIDKQARLKITGVLSNNGTTRVFAIDPEDKKHKLNTLLVDTNIYDEAGQVLIPKNSDYYAEVQRRLDEETENILKD